MTLPTPTAAGSLALAKEAFAKTVAACAVVQTLFDADDAAEAEARIWIDSLPEPTNSGGDRIAEHTEAQLVALRPFVLIGHQLRGHYQAGRVAADSWADGGRLWLLIEANVTDLLGEGESAENTTLVMRHADNLVGQLAEDLKALAWQGGGYLAIDQMEIDGPRRTDPDDPEDSGFGDHVSAFIRVHWNGGLS